MSILAIRSRHHDAALPERVSVEPNPTMLAVCTIIGLISLALVVAAVDLGGGIFNGIIG